MSLLATHSLLYGTLLCVLGELNMKGLAYVCLIIIKILCTGCAHFAFLWAL